METAFIVVAVLGGIAITITAVVAWLDVVMALFELFSLKGALLVGSAVALGVGADMLLPGKGHWVGLGSFGLLLTGLTWYLKRKEDRELEESIAAQHLLDQARAERGVAGIGTITKLERTGMSINRQPQIEFTIDVPLADGRTATVTTRKLVDIVEIPQVQPGRQVQVIYDPQDLNNFEVDFDAQPTAGAAAITGASVSSTGAEIDWPLWVFGMEDAEEWLLPPRRPGALRIVVVDLTDPHDASADADREMLVDMAAFVLTELLWTRTDMAATTMVLVNVEQRKLVQPVGELLSYEDLAGYLTSLDDQPIVAWGAALADLAREGLNLKVRMPDGVTERTFSGPLLELGETVIDWLARRDLCATIAAPPWYRAPTVADLPRYCGLLHNLQIQVLADVKNAALAPLDENLQQAFVDSAFDTVDQHGWNDQWSVIALVTAYYAHRAGRLDPVRRQRALTALRAIEHQDHPLYRLSPLLLAKLDEPLEASSRRSELLASASGAYAAWLQKTGS